MAARLAAGGSGVNAARGVHRELNGFSNVAATAHLGGAAAGFGFWLAWRKLTGPNASDSLVREV